MGKVQLTKIESYNNIDMIQTSINSMLDNSLLSKKLFDGAKVVIKTNLLMKKKPEQAVTTHPIIIECLANYFVKYNCEVIIADSPAGPFTKTSLEGIYEASGMVKAAQNSGATLNYNVSFSEVSPSDSMRLKTFNVIDVVKNADFVISAAKLKTHGMMTFTGAVKNLFGVIPGLIKAEYHFKLMNEENFAHHLIDIERYIKPDYSIIDGIEAMEGNGPSNGIKRNLGILIGADNAYEADFIACDLVSIAFKLVPTLYLAESRNIFNKNEIVVEGLDYKDLNIAPFKLPDSVDLTFLPQNTPAKLKEIIIKKLKAKPEFVHSKCISCGHCKRNCPANVISMVDNKPVVNLKDCISCFCCHEVCPADAVKIKKSLLLKLLK